MSDFSIKAGKYSWFDAGKNDDGSIGFHVSDENGDGSFLLSPEQVAEFKLWLISGAQNLNDTTSAG